MAKIVFLTELVLSYYLEPRMKSFFGCIAIAMEAKNDEIKVQNAKFVGKRITIEVFKDKGMDKRIH